VMNPAAQRCTMPVWRSRWRICQPDAEVIFERFRRGTSRRGARTSGAGLGLAIVKAIAEGHHGRVELRRTEGGGATFVLILETDS
ncbi:ATP-binding protein, partial [Streptomyces microflavus]|uniref:ATP-binding protein n=1 Tax=Streptomyces microflavus TaxID=1919 RepID=UPI0033AD17A4